MDYNIANSFKWKRIARKNHHGLEVQGLSLKWTQQKTNETAYVGDPIQTSVEFE